VFIIPLKFCFLLCQEQPIQTGSQAVCENFTKIVKTQFTPLLWFVLSNLTCLFSFSPGSDHGLLLSLVCCWSETWVVCFLLVSWPYVAHSLELWQAYSSVVPAVAYDEVVFGPSLSEAIARFFYTCWTHRYCSVFHLCYYHPKPHVLCQGCIFQLLFSPLRCTVSCLCHTMVRGCQVRTLQPMANPLHKSPGWIYFLPSLVDIPLLGLSYFSVHYVVVCLWDSLAYSLSCSFLCLAILDLTGDPVTTSVLLSQLLLIHVLRHVQFLRWFGAIKEQLHMLCMSIYMSLWSYVW